MTATKAEQEVLDLQFSGLCYVYNALYSIWFMYSLTTLSTTWYHLTGLIPFAILVALHMMRIPGYLKGTEEALSEDSFNRVVYASPVIVGCMAYSVAAVSGLSWYYSLTHAILVWFNLFGMNDPANPGTPVDPSNYKSGYFNGLLRYYTVRPNRYFSAVQLTSGISFNLILYTKLFAPSDFVAGLIVNVFVAMAFGGYGGEPEDVSVSIINLKEAKIHTHLFKHYTILLSSLFSTAYIVDGSYVSYLIAIILIAAYGLGAVVHTISFHRIEFMVNIIQLFCYMSLSNYGPYFFLPMASIFINISSLVHGKMNLRINDEVNYFIIGSINGKPKFATLRILYTNLFAGVLMTLVPLVDTNGYLLSYGVTPQILTLVLYTVMILQIAYTSYGIERD